MRVPTSYCRRRRRAARFLSILTRRRRRRRSCLIRNKLNNFLSKNKIHEYTVLCAKRTHDE